jgi:hypothetical protein
MSNRTEDQSSTSVSIVLPTDRNPPKGKLADAEIVFGSGHGPFTGTKLSGFSVWEGKHGRYVSLPGRPFTVNGNRRSYALLRPADPAVQAPMDEIRRLILDAYSACEGSGTEQATDAIHAEELA